MRTTLSPANAGDLGHLLPIQTPFPSFLRRQESRCFKIFWTPAFAGVTTWDDRVFLKSPVLPSPPPHMR